MLDLLPFADFRASGMQERADIDFQDVGDAAQDIEMLALTQN